MKKQDYQSSCLKGLLQGSLPPWKLEEELEVKCGVSAPENFREAGILRQQFITEVTGEKFSYIRISKRPFKIKYLCPQDNLIWELDARDNHLKCSLCGSSLEPTKRYSSLVSNYVGGTEAYYSYAGQLKVKGDIEKKFTHLLVYGTGLGPIGVTRGSHLINTLGGAEVKVEDFGKAARCNAYVFKSAELRQKARDTIQQELPRLTPEWERRMSEFSGQVDAVDFDQVDTQGSFILYVEVVSRFENFRGHGDISRVVGFAKKQLEDLLKHRKIEYDLSIIAQGHDGDLKPSPQNKRGRVASAEVRVPNKDFEKVLKVNPDKFLSSVQVDAEGAKRLGCQFYSGMGGEIIPAVYKATQINPQSPLVSSFQNIHTKIDKGDVVYKVVLPNIEVGIASTREGIMSPVAREALRIMGIKTAKEFAASLAAQVLAGEFNLALEISREKLYSSSNSKEKVKVSSYKNPTIPRQKRKA